MADARQGVNNGSTQTKLVLAKPRLGFGSPSFGASSSSKNSNPFGSVLRPPQLKPSSNPFLKAVDVEDKNEEENKNSSDDIKDTEVKEGVEVPKFVPLGSNATPRTNNPVPVPAQPTTSTSSSGFIFGQNISERVMQDNLNNGEAPPSDHSATNGTSGLLFTSAAASIKENNQDECSSSETESGSGEGLAAAAAEYERSHARPPPPPANVVLTGEEGETNVLQISCRLFAWEAGSWRERGRGVLRLNDAEGGGARLVARVAGSLRVVLNTKLWPGMVVERAGAKSLRITATDTQHQIKLYLIMGSPGDIEQLQHALMSRVSNCKQTSSITNSQNITSQQAAERLEAAADPNEFLVRPANDTDSISEDNEPNVFVDNTIEQESSKSERLETINKQTDDNESSVDNETQENAELKPLKRKEPTNDETSRKRLCTDITE